MVNKRKNKFDEELRFAIESGNNVKAISMLNIRAEKYNVFGTLLHHAAASDNVVIARELIKLGAGIERRARYGNTPLLLALKSNRRSVVEVLLEANADIDAQDAQGTSALRLALGECHSEIAEAFVHRLKTEARTTARLAKRLIAAGCNMSHAATFADFDLLQCMLKRGIDIDSRNSRDATTLHKATEHGDLKLVEWLINNGADVNARGLHGIDALIIATQVGSKDMIEILLKFGADANSCYHWDGYTPLYELFANPGRRVKDYVECAEVLLRYGAVPRNLTVESSPTIFDEALVLPSDKAAKLLVSHLAMLELLGTSITESVMYCHYRENQPEMTKLMNFYVVCQQVLVTSISGNVSLIELLKASDCKMNMQVRSESFVSTVEKSCRQLKKWYLYYYNTLVRRIDKAKRLVVLEDQAIPVICKMFKGNYNQCYNFARTVVGYLDERDLEQLIKV